MRTPAGSISADRDRAGPGAAGKEREIDMLLSRSPVRISLGGGGTDLKSYYSQFGGFLIAGAINKYVFIVANPHFSDSIRLSYSQTEIVDSVAKIKHPIFREALQMLKIEKAIELVSVADVPSNSGLGSSSAFTVALLNSLHHFHRDYITLKDLAEEACRLEIDRMGKPIGKQDQYASAFGGINAYWFEKDGSVRVEPVRLPREQVNDLERNILLFYIGKSRSADDILAVQDKATSLGDRQMVEKLHHIKEIGLRTKAAFEKGDIDAFGELLHEHWMTKKRLSKGVSDPAIDELYEIGKANGALGGKIIGAGGGGFLMLYCPGEKAKLIEVMAKNNVHPLWFRFEFEGARVIFAG